jgi:nitrate/TMAO reductase-like tetraheme cytochrome c subunit
VIICLKYLMKFQFYILISILFISFSCISKSDNKGTVSNDIAKTVSYDTVLYFLNGQKIFRADCNSCHVVKGRLHNYLEGVVQRLGEDYLRKYITKQDSLIAAKDGYALAVKEEWNNQGNSHNFNYTDKHLKELIEYLR